MIQNIKLLKKELIAKDTMAFYWEKPTGFEFTAGQFGDFTLINPPETDDEGNIRGFSFVQAPYEQDLVIATRMRDTAFKRVLKDLAIGTEVKLDAPYGDFRLHKNEELPAVFLIGGIGITPVRSIISQATHDQLAHHIILLYSNKTPADAAFTKDLEELSAKNSNFVFVPVYSKAGIAQPETEQGHIDVDMLKRHVADISLAIYYLAGPAPMVKAMRELLITAGADEDKIRTEEFSGY